MSFHGDTKSRKLLDSIAEQLAEICTLVVVDNGVRVRTHCMYPSNSMVEVVVHGGTEFVSVSDGGGAMSEASSAGISTPFSDKTLAAQIAGQGLKVSKGHIWSPRISIQAAPVGILLVANASKEVAQWCYDHARIKRERDFKKLLAEFLEGKFPQNVGHQVAIVGASNKVHKFANVINIDGGKRLIIDPVANDPSSINARVVANLDVKATNDDSIIQRIVYDDEADWSPADLNLLSVGAPAIAFSRSAPVIERLVANG